MNVYWRLSKFNNDGSLAVNQCTGSRQAATPWARYLKTSYSCKDSQQSIQLETLINLGYISTHSTWWLDLKAISIHLGFSHSASPIDSNTPFHSAFPIDSVDWSNKGWTLSSDIMKQMGTQNYNFPISVRKQKGEAVIVAVDWQLYSTPNKMRVWIFQLRV